MVRTKHTAGSAECNPPVNGRGISGDIYSPKVITPLIYGLLSGREKVLNQHSSSTVSEGGQQVRAAAINRSESHFLFLPWAHTREGVECKIAFINQLGKK